MSKNKLYGKVVSVSMLIGLVAAPALSSADVAIELEERKKILAEVDHRMSDKKLLAKALEAGRERVTLCATCHGVDGNSKKSEYPNLASQNPTYIIEQMAKFSDGRRKSFVMGALVRSFTREDETNLAVYFSSQKLKPVPEANPLLANRGEQKYKEVCFRCHGESGRGEEGYARVAGQRVEYVMTTLKRFRSNAQHAADFDETKRTNALMEQVTQFLSDEDIESLAHYLALMK